MNFDKKMSLLIHKIAPYSWLDDKYWLEYYFQKTMGYRLDLKHPKTFNEKLQWMKLYDRNPLYTKLADKYSVREYVTEKIGARYLNDLVGVYDAPEEINWSSLPTKFVLKTTHGSGWNIICSNKEKLDIKESIIKLQNWMSQNFYRRFREWHYKDIKPKIIIEQFIEGDPDFDLVDYRVFCINGKPQIIQVEVNTYTYHTRGFFDLNWNNLNFTYKYPLTNKRVPRPEQLPEMLQLSSQLTENIRFCRVDFLINEKKLTFGEMTFIPFAGYANFEPKSYDMYLGKLIPIN